MIADEIFSLTIDRNLFNARGEQILRGLCYTKKGEHPVEQKEFIIELKDITINGVKIQGDAITLGTQHISIGFLTESEKTLIENGKEIKNKHLAVNKTAEITEIKTISFKQEIGTSKRWMGVNIYIKDSYSTIKEKIKEIR